MLIKSVAVVGAVTEMGGVSNPQVGGLTTSDGLITVHVNRTLPLKVSFGITVMVEVAGTPTDATRTAVLVRSKLSCTPDDGSVTK